MDNNQAHIEINVIRNLTNGDITEIDRVRLPTEYTQLYVHARKLMATVTQIATFQMFLWVLERMDKEGCVSLGKHDKETFVKDMLAMGGHGYSMSQISRAIKELKDVGMISILCQPKYYVNITAAWKASTKERIKQVKEWLPTLNPGTSLPGNLSIERKKIAENE